MVGMLCSLESVVVVLVTAVQIETESVVVVRVEVVNIEAGGRYLTGSEGDTDTRYGSSAHVVARSRTLRAV